MNKRRAALFVDGSNFFKFCERRGIYAYQLLWDEFLINLVMDRKITFAYYYDAPKRENEVPDQARKQKQFWSHLYKIPWLELKLGRLEGGDGGRPLVEKGVDVQIAIDMVMGAMEDRYDDAYLLSADGDFSYAIDMVKSKFEKRVLVASPGKSHHLKQSADAYIYLLDTRLKKFLRRHGGP